MDGIVMKKKRWLIKLSDEQLMSIALGMEYYHRMMCGQVDAVDYVCGHRISNTLKNTLKEMMFPGLSFYESYNWNGDGADKSPFVKEMAQSYQIYREILHQFAIRDGDDNVYSSPTLSSDKVESLYIEQIK